MQVYDFSKSADRSKLRDLFLNHFKRKDIVPFFGSGFTRGYPAREGKVPSVAELKDELISIIVKVENYSESDKTELDNMELSQLADIFWPTLEREDTPQEYRDRFDTYIENHFCHVHDLPVAQRKLINCRWRYLYTLNYDDAIEQASKDLTVIAPYSGQNKNWLSRRRCLYKLHGDAEQFLKTGKSKYCILSTQQYLQALDDSENQYMRQNLETDFYSNNLIFFGCSLLSELDMLLAAGTKLAQGKRQNKDTRSYYVRYIGGNTEPLTPVQRSRYKNFAITDIIEVKGEQLQDFYSFLTDISNDAGQLQSSDSLSEFTAHRFLRQDPTSRENIEYLFLSSLIWPKNGTNEITLPSFFIRRDETQKIIDSINAGDGNFHILRGRRLSGKTYALIDLLKEFRARNTYYFPSKKQLSDQCFERLLSMKNAILIFDEHCLTVDQIGSITTKYREMIQRNKTHLVTAIDRSIGMFTRHYFERFPDMKGFVKIYTLSSALNESEAEHFNAEFGKLGLINYQRGWSFLDLMLKVDDASIQKHRSGLPDINIIEDIATVKALILFANQESITMSQGNMMGIAEALYGLCQTTEVAIQKDYLSEAELSPTVHDSFRFVANSKYWVYKCLSAYAGDSLHFSVIADAFYEIVNTIQNQYGPRFRKSYYQAVQPYYFFETIQFMFFSDPQQPGSLFLPDVIYKRLLPLFKDDFQFLHQKAKCLLWNSRKRRTAKDRADMLNEALQQITRAIELAKMREPVNFEYTLYHMDVTKVLILVNNWRYCQTQFREDELPEQLSHLLRAFYEMEQRMQTWGEDPDLDAQEMQDINWFVSQLAVSPTQQQILPEDRDMAGRVMTLWFKMN